MSNLQFTPGLLLFILFMLIVLIAWGSYAFQRAGNNSILKEVPSGTPLSIFFLLLILVFVVLYFRQISDKSKLVNVINEEQSLPIKEMGIRMVPDVKPAENKRVVNPLIGNVSDTIPRVQPKTTNPYYDNEYPQRNNLPTPMVQQRDTVAKLTWSQGYAVQAGAFHDEASAIKYALELCKVYDRPVVWVEGSDREGRLCYKVLIGIFRDARAADQFAQNLPRSGFIKGFKVDLTKMKLKMI